MSATIATPNSPAGAGSSPSSLLGLARMSKHWPASYRDRIPTKVRMAKDIGPCMWHIIPKGPRIWVMKDDELPVQCNQHGAISVVTPYGNLGVKPLECEIIEWREPNSAERPNENSPSTGATEQDNGRTTLHLRNLGNHE